MISVIIPTYQHAGTIAACLDSVLTQRVKEIEVIVVNDGSTDGTNEILKAYANRVKVITQPNQGSNLARNHGFEISGGEQVIFCDADVIMREDMLEQLAKALQAHPGVAFAYSAFRFGWKAFSSYDFDEARLKRMNYIHTTALIRRRAFPGFDPKIKRLQDWDVWLTMLEQGHKGIRVAEELFHIEDAPGRHGISQWHPSFLYKIPWAFLGWSPRSLRQFFEAKKIVQQKHGLPV